MKHGQLIAVAHNLADSIADGNGFLIGYFPTQIFEEAASGSDGHITIDFVRRQVSGSNPSEQLQRALRAHFEILPEFCERNGCSIEDFAELIVRFSQPTLQPRVVVTVEDKRGRRSDREYAGLPAKRVKVLDRLGRIRPKVRQQNANGV